MSDLNPVRVLIVDDSDDQLQLLRAYFERAGCVVSVAGTAKDAMLAWDVEEPELTVIDLVLPGMDGWELAAHLRDRHPGCAIAITSVLGEEHYPEGHVVMPKPVTSSHVRQALEATVPRWKAA
jgi:DNA-binding response OmpR family regulator